MQRLSLDEAIFRAEQLVLDVQLLNKLLHDLDFQRKNPDAIPPPPRDRPPSVAPPQPGTPAPTTYGPTPDRAATADMKRTLRAVAKTSGMTSEAQLDAMAMRKFKKARWNLISQREYMMMMRAIESGER